MQSLKNVWIALAVVTVIAVGAYFFPQVKSFVGAVGTRFPNGLAVGTTATVTQNKLTVGNSGTALGTVISGTCNLTGGDVSQNASTTKEYICSATGVAAGDKIFINFATTSAPAVTGFGTMLFVGAKATTSNQFGVGIYNGTGAGQVLSAPGPFSGLGSSTQYFIVR